MSKYKRIFIVGHAGAGKAVLAKALAEKLGWKFINADFGLAPIIGRSLNEIVGKQGEEEFQHCLSEILAYQRSQENIVVTTDDSIICSDKNRQLLAAEFTVHLKVSTSVQLDRVRISNNRPLLPIADYKVFLDKLHHERDSLYNEAASFSISSDNGAVDEHVLSVINAFEK